VLDGLPQNEGPRVLADYRHASDAGVHLLSDDRALVQSVDFFTPIIDDPRVFGAISAPTLSVPKAKEKALVSAFAKRNARGWRIGAVREGTPKVTIR
jgi:selenophosphate synthase